MPAAHPRLERPAFYALRPGGWRDVVTLLRPPYTAWHLSYVALGAAVAPTLHVDRLLAALGAFFLAVGLCAHALDELNGRPLGTALSNRTLVAVAVVSLLGAVAIGTVGIATVSVSLIPFVLANRERLVLKPNDDYGGKGIVLGWTVDFSTWEQAVQIALATPYIVQERIRLPSEPYPSFVDGKLQWIDRLFDTAPFVTHGASMDACLTRISTAALLNVTAGGGSTVPTFLIEKR